MLKSFLTKFSFIRQQIFFQCFFSSSIAFLWNVHLFIRSQILSESIFEGILTSKVTRNQIWRMPCLIFAIVFISMWNSTFSSWYGIVSSPISSLNNLVKPRNVPYWFSDLSKVLKGANFMRIPKYRPCQLWAKFADFCPLCWLSLWPWSVLVGPSFII